MNIDIDIIKQALRNATKIKNEQCLCPYKECNIPVTRCHSIQNKRILAEISTDNHVYRIKQDINKINHNNLTPKLAFEKCSIHGASTFNGLCNKHDSEIFRPIDTEKLTLQNVQHIFLLSYRSVLMEMTELLEKWHRDEYLTTVLPNTTNPIYNQYWVLDFVKYKHHFDLLYRYGAYNGLYYKTLTLNQKAQFAASACFSTIEESTKYNGTERIIVNIFPYNGKTCVIFASLQKDGIHMDRYLNQLLTASNKQQLYLLSKLILKNCNNIIFSPKLIESWSSDKKRVILQYSYETQQTDKTGYDNDNLCLF